jgi:DNA polymerase III subunit delta'
VAQAADDPRESLLHPRFAPNVVGHERAVSVFESAVAAGKPHHAWLLTGPKGIGKATLAYALAKSLLGGAAASRLIEARAHPDLFVLERQMGDGKQMKLKSEIAVDDARDMSKFFARTAAMSRWRVAIIDTADDLNTESANALLKLIEEPPAGCIVFLVCNQPGRILRTIRSRCLRLELGPLSEAQMQDVFSAERFSEQKAEESWRQAVDLAQGSPGLALHYHASPATKAYAALLSADIRRAEGRLAVAGSFEGRGPTPEDFELFIGLLLQWLANRAKDDQKRSSHQLASAYSDIHNLARKTSAFNLDRKLAILECLSLVTGALKAA